MTLRDVLEDRWTELDGNPPTSGLTTSPLPVDTTSGPLLSAVDARGGRHLLIPLKRRQSLTPDSKSRGIRLVLRPLEDAKTYQVYADLELLEPALASVFTSLCEDALLAVSRQPDRAVRAVREVVDSWRSLLAGAGRPLGAEALAGLFGELMVLKQLAAVDEGIANAWRGPWGDTHDFTRGSDALEVKSTTSRSGRTTVIHGLKQLETPTDGRLTLIWLRLSVDGQDRTTVPALVDAVLGLVDSPAQVRNALAELGYYEVDRKLYEDVAFEVIESAYYAIEDGFPRIVPSGLKGDALSPSISNLSYSVDLDVEPARQTLTPAFLPRFGLGRNGEA